MNPRSRKQRPSPYVVGRPGFAAISTVEGLKLTREAEERLQRTRALPPDQRRAETIRVFVENRKRG